jgi:bile acid:Na+ symporter, BASS family
MTAQQAIVLALQASIMMTVFGFGLEASPGDVLYLVRRPSLLGRSLLAMFVIMPAFAILVVKVFALPPPVEIALVALSISPIPPILPARQLRVGGDASYGLGLMVITGLLSILIVPVAVEILARSLTRPFAMPPAAIARVVLLIAILPLAAGVACRAMWPAVAARIAKPIDLIAKVGLVIGVLAILASVVPAIFSQAGEGAVAAMAAFVLVGLAVGHWLGGPDADHRPVLALSTASRHPAIALAIAKANFPDEPYLGAAIVLFLLVNLLVAVPYLRRQKQRLTAVSKPAVSG